MDSVFLYDLVPIHIPASLSLFHCQSLSMRWRFHMAIQTDVVECTPFKNPWWSKIKCLFSSEEQIKVQFAGLPGIVSNLLSRNHLCNSWLFKSSVLSQRNCIWKVSSVCPQYFFIHRTQNKKLVLQSCI